MRQAQGIDSLQMRKSQASQKEAGRHGIPREILSTEESGTGKEDAWASGLAAVRTVLLLSSRPLFSPL